MFAIVLNTIRYIILKQSNNNMQQAKKHNKFNDCAVSFKSWTVRKLMIRNHSSFKYIA